MPSDYNTEIAQALEDVLGTAPAAITAETSFQEDISLDSMMFVQFLVALEDRVPGFSFDDDELDFDAFQTVGALSAAIAARLPATVDA